MHAAGGSKSTFTGLIDDDDEAAAEAEGPDVVSFVVARSISSSGIDGGGGATSPVTLPPSWTIMSDVVIVRMELFVRQQQCASMCSVQYFRRTIHTYYLDNDDASVRIEPNTPLSSMPWHGRRTRPMGGGRGRGDETVG